MFVDFRCFCLSIPNARGTSTTVWSRRSLPGQQCTGSSIRRWVMFFFCRYLEFFFPHLKFPIYIAILFFFLVVHLICKCNISICVWILDMWNGKQLVLLFVPNCSIVSHWSYMVVSLTKIILIIQKKLPTYVTIPFFLFIILVCKFNIRICKWILDIWNG